MFILFRFFILFFSFFLLSGCFGSVSLPSSSTSDVSGSSSLVMPPSPISKTVSPMPTMPTMPPTPISPAQEIIDGIEEHLSMSGRSSFGSNYYDGDAATSRVYVDLPVDFNSEFGIGPVSSDEIEVSIAEWDDVPASRITSRDNQIYTYRFRISDESPYSIDGLAHLSSSILDYSSLTSIIVSQSDLRVSDSVAISNTFLFPYSFRSPILSNLPTSVVSYSGDWRVSSQPSTSSDIGTTTLSATASGTFALDVDFGSLNPSLTDRTRTSSITGAALSDSGEPIGVFVAGDIITRDLDSIKFESLEFHPLSGRLLESYSFNNLFGYFSGPDADEIVGAGSGVDPTGTGVVIGIHGKR